jgi:hypothetical protein
VQSRTELAGPIAQALVQDQRNKYQGSGAFHRCW